MSARGELELQEPIVDVDSWTVLVQLSKLELETLFTALEVCRPFDFEPDELELRLRQTFTRWNRR